MGGWDGSRFDQDANVHSSEKGENDYSHGKLCLNSTDQIRKGMCSRGPQRSTRAHLSQMWLANINFYFMLKYQLILFIVVCVCLELSSQLTGMTKPVVLQR